VYYQYKTGLYSYKREVLTAYILRKNSFYTSIYNHVIRDQTWQESGILSGFLPEVFPGQYVPQFRKNKIRSTTEKKNSTLKYM
jgi:hypothetical protein